MHQGRIGIFLKSVFILFFAMVSAHAVEEAASETPTASASSGFVQLKPTITTNYTSSRLKYVRADVAIRADNKIIDAVTLHKDPIRDLIIMLLARQDRETLTTSEGIAAIREEAKEEINAFLESENQPADVIDVLFMSFLVE